VEVVDYLVVVVDSQSADSQLVKIRSEVERFLGLFEVSISLESHPRPISTRLFVRGISVLEDCFSFLGLVGEFVVSVFGSHDNRLNRLKKFGV
jgi:hypothetical protein